MIVLSFLSRGLLLAGLLVAASIAVAAADDEIGLSRDGATWSATLPGPLFDPAFRWVPGDDETETFFVRNQGPSTAVLTVSARSTDTDRLLSNEDIDLFARVDGGAWVELANGVSSDVLRTIVRGAQGRIDVRARFDPASTNPSENKSLQVTFVITLADASVGSDGNDRDDGDDGDGDGDDNEGNGGDDRDDGLPGAGSSIGPQALWIAAVLIGGGLALVRRARGEERADV